MKKILCIHAHESNIYYLDKLLRVFRCTIEHRVINLMDNTKKSKEILKKEINSYLSEDIAVCILTCTEHSSMVDEDSINGVSILKIEEPIIEKLLYDHNDKVLVFTNPNTVDLTVNKIKNSKYQFQNYKIDIIPESFDLILKNEKTLYKNLILDYISKESKDIYLMQLSMSIVQEESLFDGKRMSTVYREAERKYNKIISNLLKINQ